MCALSIHVVTTLHMPCLLLSGTDWNHDSTFYPGKGVAGAPFLDDVGSWVLLFSAGLLVGTCSCTALMHLYIFCYIIYVQQFVMDPYFASAAVDALYL